MEHRAVEVRKWVLDCGFGAGDEGEGEGWGGAEEEHVHNVRILRSFDSMMGGNSGKARTCFADLDRIDWHRCHGDFN